jgi:hypothetical protein
MSLRAQCELGEVRVLITNLDPWTPQKNLGHLWGESDLVEQGDQRSTPLVLWGRVIKTLCRIQGRCASLITALSVSFSPKAQVPRALLGKARNIDSAWKIKGNRFLHDRGFERMQKHRFLVILSWLIAGVCSWIIRVPVSDYPGLYEASIQELQSGLDNKTYTSVDLVKVSSPHYCIYVAELPSQKAYRARVEEVNLKGANLRSVLETSPLVL